MMCWSLAGSHWPGAGRPQEAQDRQAGMSLIRVCPGFQGSEVSFDMDLLSGYVKMAIENGDGLYLCERLPEGKRY